MIFIEKAYQLKIVTNTFFYTTNFRSSCIISDFFISVAIVVSQYLPVVKSFRNNNFIIKVKKFWHIIFLIEIFHNSYSNWLLHLKKNQNHNTIYL